MEDEPVHSARRKPLSEFMAAVQNGRFLKFVFFGMLALTVGTLTFDLTEMMANAPQGIPGSQRLEPAPMVLPSPGDQTRTYLPKSMPLGPNRETPRLPGYFGPLSGEVMSQPMAFFKGPNDEVSAIGTITPGTADTLRSFIEDNPKAIGTIVLHSPGGSVSDAIAMSEMIRAEGISTRVPAHGYCASSCPLVLSGGLTRKAGKNAWVGVHQIYAPPPAVGTLQRGMSDAQAISARCQRLLSRMDVDPEVWIYAMQTPSAELYIFRAEQLARLRLANARMKLTRPNFRPSPAEDA